jgi:hypothetical protein
MNMNDWFQKFLGLIITCGFMGLLVLWTFYPPRVEADIKTLLVGLAGVLAGHAGAVVQWYFGSSRGSAAKDQAVGALIAKSGPPVGKSSQLVGSLPVHLENAPAGNSPP